jgi:uncharacterized membrane protein
MVCVRAFRDKGECMYNVFTSVYICTMFRKKTKEDSHITENLPLTCMTIFHFFLANLVKIISSILHWWSKNF